MHDLFDRAQAHATARDWQCETLQQLLLRASCVSTLLVIQRMEVRLCDTRDALPALDRARIEPPGRCPQVIRVNGTRQVAETRQLTAAQ